MAAASRACWHRCCHGENDVGVHDPGLHRAITGAASAIGPALTIALSEREHGGTAAFCRAGPTISGHPLDVANAPGEQQRTDR